MIMDHLKVKIDPFPFQIEHGDSILLIGSCFSEEVHAQFRKHGFNSVSNPFGTVFHPAPLARFITETLQGSVDERILQREDVFLSWDASSLIYAMSEKEVRSKLEQIRSAWKTKLTSSNHIFITLGSSWGYLHKDQQLLVANCHKFPPHHFEKTLSRVDEIVKCLKDAYHAIKSVNTKVNIIFTVSPVRHMRDGLVENTRSKSILHLAVQEMLELPGCYYFPSFELMIDELRDYRYYTEDMIHPNNQAVEQIWRSVSHSFFSEETTRLSAKVASLKSAGTHKLMFPDSQEAKRFTEKLQKEIEIFQDQYPEIIW